jgi:hypothetical protein
MFETIVTILIFVAVIAITAVLFGGWLVLTIVRALGRAIFSSKGRDWDLTMLETTAATTARCPNDRCRAENPAAASFCRRCGTAMRSVQQVPVRRVAMW